MKKIITIIATLTLVSVGAKAQNSAFGRGDLVWNAGYGIVGGMYDNSHNTYNTVVNPVSISAEYGIVTFAKYFTIGLGAYVSGNYADKIEPITEVTHYFGSIVTAGRLALHINLLSFIDIGVGANVGYNFTMERKDGGSTMDYLPKKDEGEFAWAPYLSARVMLGSVGIFGEAGFGNISQLQNSETINDVEQAATFVNVGLSFKF